MGSLFAKPPKQSDSTVISPALPWTVRINIFFFGTAVNLSRRPDGTVNRRIFRFLEFCGFNAPPNPKPRHGVATSDLTVDHSRNLWFRIFVPCSHSKESDPPARLPVVVFFHGGGFILLSPNLKLYDDFGRRLAREVNAVVVSVNYRLAPEHRYPAQFEDGFDVLKFLDDRKDVMPENADVSRCFVGGDSAGGNVAHHVAKRACESKLLSRVQASQLTQLTTTLASSDHALSISHLILTLMVAELPILLPIQNILQRMPGNSKLILLV